MLRVLLELLNIIAVAVGFLRAVRARHKLAVLCGALLLYLLLADLAAACAVTGPRSPFDLFGYMFLGPLASPERAAGILPLPGFALDYPLGLRAARIVLGTIAAAVCLRQSSRLNPLLPRAYTLDGIAMPFVGGAVVDSIECVLLMWAFAMTAFAG